MKVKWTQGFIVHGSLSAVVVVLVCIAWWGLAGHSFAAAPAEPVLKLSPDSDHYFIGPYLAYMEDPQKRLTIEAASSPQLATRFVRHNGKMLNLGLSSSAYWIRFTVDASGVKVPLEKWLLYFDWPNRIDHATLYMPKFPESGWLTREVGSILPSGPDPQPSTPSSFLTPQSVAQPVTFYLKVASSETKIVRFQILTSKAYEGVSRVRSLWFGIYYGIMLAMFLYNLILLISLRELNRLYYLLYLICMNLLFLESNGLLWEFWQIGIRLGQVLVLIFISLTFFWSNLFARSFLITKKYAPYFDKLLFAAMILAIVLAAMIPFVDLIWMTIAISFQSILVPPIFLLAAFICWRGGFRPARFFLLAFAFLALSTMYDALAIFGVLPYLTPYSAQFGSAIEVILLQMALADRFRTLNLEHAMIKQSLDLAREVQQNLLPRDNPQMQGLDVAGRSIYCDETGGDYYDFITGDADEADRMTVAIGDVSGHGISAALLMAAVRSSLRQRLTRRGGAGGIISDVNRQLVQDVEDSGQFMTLFYLGIDTAKMQIQWVRAGHDPAIFYDPDADVFEELDGSGMALGIDEDWQYEAYRKSDLKSGQIIFLSTDGIWEAFNPSREMFGKERIHDIIRNNSSLTASEIIDIMIGSLKKFQKGAPREDDITLVVVKIT
jgi:serine phosphatase RsbU (regulator of sigma subunit)